MNVAEALWSQRHALADAYPRLNALREAVDSPSDLTMPQWAHLFAIAMELAPDCIIELGRGYGNSTADFTEAANRLGNCRVISVGYDGEQGWSNRSAPRIQPIVGEDWFKPLTVIDADILTVDFTPYIQQGSRILLLWDAHGTDVAHYVLAHLLPQLRGKQHMVIVHDITDGRYCNSSRAYVRDDGYPTVWADFLTSPFEELIPAYDFLSRNQIPIQTPDYDIHEGILSDPARLQELQTLWKDTYGDPGPLGAGHFLYFSLDDQPDGSTPLQFPVIKRAVTETPDEASLLEQRILALRSELEELQREIEAIRRSRTWRTAAAIKRSFGRLPFLPR